MAHSAQDAVIPSDKTRRRRRITPAQMVGIVAVTLFISTEVAAVSAAAVWGISGLLGLKRGGEITLSVAFGLPTLFAVVRTAQLAVEAETDPENN
ncbi:hypothetical protein [Nitratireductor pacificus]|uniref:Uncharacterized protein n=1 Tax=Nitratireductor pacificus pht-3B TaxID=391937 RepID=K2LRF5_9HYPH|nr:hypothetical protein [Nitratireductor pacificus]EKF20339.1 hypothetical protein NA2_03757 [Nitratireductor pacificus pht-3B]